MPPLGTVNAGRELLRWALWGLCLGLKALGGVCPRPSRTNGKTNGTGQRAGFTGKDQSRLPGGGAKDDVSARPPPRGLLNAGPAHPGVAQAWTPTQVPGPAPASPIPAPDPRGPRRPPPGGGERSRGSALRAPRAGPVRPRPRPGPWPSPCPGPSSYPDPDLGPRPRLRPASQIGPNPGLGPSECPDPGPSLAPPSSSSPLIGPHAHPGPCASSCLKSQPSP